MKLPFDPTLISKMNAFGKAVEDNDIGAIADAIGNDLRLPVDVTDIRSFLNIGQDILSEATSLEAIVVHPKFHALWQSVESLMESMNAEELPVIYDTYGSPVVNVTKGFFNPKDKSFLPIADLIEGFADGDRKNFYPLDSVNFNQKGVSVPELAEKMKENNNG